MSSVEKERTRKGPVGVILIIISFLFIHAGSSSYLCDHKFT